MDDQTLWMTRATAYELGAFGFFLPDGALADAVGTGEYAAAADEVLEALGCESIERKEIAALLRAGEASSAADPSADERNRLLHELRREYTRLFVGQYEPPVTPYVGVWDSERQGKPGFLAVGKESMAIERFMRDCGVVRDAASSRPNAPMDHIGTVLEFLMHLCLLKASAVAPPKGFDVPDDAYRTFYCDHFQDYGSWLADRLAAQAQHSFYRGLGLYLGHLAAMPAMREGFGQ